MIFTAKDISFSYGLQRVLNGISFQLGAGSALCLLGANGAGKSTLIKCLAGINPPSAGEILINGVSAAKMRRKDFARRVAYIPQSAAPVFPIEVRDFVAMGRAPHKSFFSQPDSKDYKMVRETLEKLGIARLEYKMCTELSGGERQMALFASAIVQEPELLLLDEPTSHLDFGNQIKVLKTVKNLAEEKGISIIMATHAPEHAFLAGNLAALLKGGRMCAWGPPASAITEESVCDVFGVKVKIADIDKGRGIKSCTPLMD